MNSKYGEARKNLKCLNKQSYSWFKDTYIYSNVSDNLNYGNKFYADFDNKILMIAFKVLKGNKKSKLENIFYLSESILFNNPYFSDYNLIVYNTTYYSEFSKRNILFNINNISKFHRLGKFIF